MALTARYFTHSGSSLFPVCLRAASRGAATAHAVPHFLVWHVSRMCGWDQAFWQYPQEGHGSGVDRPTEFAFLTSLSYSLILCACIFAGPGIRDQGREII